MKKNKNRVKNIFLFFIFFLPLQYAFAGLIGMVKSEPWPALVLPAFKATAFDSSDLLVPQFVIKTDRGRQQLNIHKLFKELEQSQKFSFIKNNFSDSAQVKIMSQNAKNWLKGKIYESISDSVNLKALYIYWVKKPNRYSEHFLNEPTSLPINKRLVIYFR